MKILPEALSELMALRETTQTELAAATGLTDATVSYYLKGERGKEMSPQVLDTLGRFSVALDVPMDYWLEYRLWRVQQLGLQYPDLVDEIYDLLLDHAATEDEAQSKRESRRT